jgi:redox-sensitive bicupin YhaK (pirin superfamily)
MHIEARKSLSRGHASYTWLETYHSFSFNDYYEPERTKFSVLRVINEDFIAPKSGFPQHPHHDMEIITYMLAGTLSHQDSLGHRQDIHAGEVQVMTAGRGIEHSEFNPSDSENAHLLQIWVYPKFKGLTPSYHQRSFTTQDKLNRWCLIASPDEAQGSLRINQDAKLWSTLLAQGHKLEYQSNSDRSAYLHVAKGNVKVNNTMLSSGDAVAIEQVTQCLTLEALTDTEVLLFDLPLSNS